MLLIVFSFVFQGCSITFNEDGSISLGAEQNSDSEDGENNDDQSSSNGDADIGGGSSSGGSNGIQEYPKQEKEDKDISYSTFKKGSITTKDTVLETEHFIIEIDKNVYVPGYVKEYVEVIYDALETVSGLSFYNEHYNAGKITIEVVKPNKPEFPETEMQGAYAVSKGAKVNISSGDLLLGNSYALTHELSHILMYSQSSWSYSRVYVEGFAEYNSYKAVKYLEATNIEVAYSLVTSVSHIANMSFHNGKGNVYNKPVEYWIENESEAYDFSGNGPYAVGMRFMNYLDHVYGNYTDWIMYYENKVPYYSTTGASQEIGLQEQLSAMKNKYGKSVFNNFYGWLSKNEEIYESPWYSEKTNYDLTNANYIHVYPEFNASGDETLVNYLYKFSYDNLYICIDEARIYLQNYKNKNVSKLKLILDEEKNVEFYNSNDQLIRSEKGKEFSLLGVSYIKLVGKGSLGGPGIDGLEITY
jgi:hypothetical protein